MDYLNLIRDLTNAKGAPGFEDEVLEVIEANKGSYGFERDVLKNAYLNLDHLDPTKPTLMLDSHTDEVAFIVKAIDENGLLLLQPLGGWMAEHAIAQTFWVRNQEGHYHRGITVSKPIHFMSAEERAKKITLTDLKIDLGAHSRQEVIKDFKVSVGQPIVPTTRFDFDVDHQVMYGKAFDNRIGVAVSLAIMHELADEIQELPLNVVAAFAAQEEVGLRGAVVTSRRVQPQMALVFEGTPSDDFTGTSLYTEQARMGQGTQLRFMDQSYIANDWLTTYFSQLADRMKLPIQKAVREGGSTNAGSIHLSQQGVPVATLGVPTRYAHTPSCYCSYQDFKTTIDLSLAFIRSLRPEDFANFNPL